MAPTSVLSVHRYAVALRRRAASRRRCCRPRFRGTVDGSGAVGRLVGSGLVFGRLLIAGFEVRFDGDWRLVGHMCILMLADLVLVSMFVLLLANVLLLSIFARVRL